MGKIIWIVSYLLYSFVMAFIMLAVFAHDEAIANGKFPGKMRVPERALLLLSIFGGWLGAVIGIKAMRHKSNTERKWYFQTPIYLSIVFWVIAGILFFVL